MPRQRLDKLLLDLGFFETREQARGAIMAGLVTINGDVEDKPGHGVADDAVVQVRGKEHPYVSRGGVKLERALGAFSINVNGRACLDVGASTGGFTDCLLQHGAAGVTAVDVGHGQLDPRLAADRRVTVRDGTNARHLTPEQVPAADLITVDVSFISLAKILPAVVGLLTPSAAGVVCLVKPQFEAGRERVGKGGIVRDPEVWLDCLEAVARAGEALGLRVAGHCVSPIRGPKGNVEFFLLLVPAAERPAPPVIRDELRRTVRAVEAV